VAEVDKDYKQMWSMLANADEEWENEPSSEVLASNVFFHSLMTAVNSLVRACSDFSLTDQERKQLIKEMNANISSADWVAKLYSALLDIKAEQEEEQDK
tara:strand:+ start:661 stop:957 length:297 start_codon:yes stop_codon:yes gene_type:complete